MAEGVMPGRVELGEIWFPRGELNFGKRGSFYSYRWRFGAALQERGEVVGFGQS
jgi:hypothetical protein